MSVSQTLFRTALLDPAKPVPGGLSDGIGQPAGGRFAVYRNNVAVGLTEALELSFPAIVKLLGAENFKSIAGIFLRQHPPLNPIMMRYGAEFPDFLQRFEALSHLAYLPDVAQLEQAIRLSYHAADVAPLAPEALQELSPEALASARFQLVPTLHLVRSPWPIHAIWAFNLEDGPKPTPEAQNVLILRPVFDPELTKVSNGTATFIAALQTNNTLADANDLALDADPDFDLPHAISLLISGQAITRIKTGDE